MLKLLLLALGIFSSVFAEGLQTPAHASHISNVRQTTLWSKKLEPSILALRRKPRVRRYAGSSRGGFCPVTPHQDFEVHLLSDRPILIWRGSIGAIEIHKPGEAKPIWRRVVQPQGPEVVNQVRYGGPVLQPGESYEWHFFKTPNSAGAVRKVQFQVLEQNLRGPVIRQLLRRDVELRQAGASLNEQLESRLDILEERGLWLDLLQEVSLASTRKALSPDDVQWLQELIAERCDNSVTSSASRIDNSRPESHIKSWMRSEK